VYIVHIVSCVHSARILSFIFVKRLLFSILSTHLQLAIYKSYL